MLCIFRTIHKIRIYIMLIAILMLIGMNNGLSEKATMRFEDINYIGTQNSGVSYALSNEYLLSAKGYDESNWVPTQFAFTLENLAEGTSYKIETISASRVYLFSDNKVFYIVASFDKEYFSDENKICVVGVFDPENGQIEWNSPIQYDSLKSQDAVLQDAVLVNKDIILIFSDRVEKYTISDCTIECLFQSQYAIANNCIYNHVCVYQNDVFVQDSSGAIFRIDTLNNITQRLNVRAKVYTPAIYDAELGRYKYYVCGDELIFNEANLYFEQMVALDLNTENRRVIFHGAFSVFCHDENGIYIDLIDYGTEKFLFNIETNAIKIVSRDEFELLEIMKLLFPNVI